MTALPNNKKIVILGGGTNTYISNHLALSAPAYGTTAIELAKNFKIHSENKMDVQLILTKMASSGIDCAKVRNELKDCNNEILELSSISNRNRTQEKLLQSRYPYKARLENYLGSFEGLNPDTPEEVESIVDKLVTDPDTRVIIFNVAMVDYKPLSLYTEKAVAEGYDQVLLTQDFGKYTQRLSTSKDPYINLELKPYDKIINKIRKERKDILLVGFKTTCGATKEEQFQKGLKLCKDASANIVFVNDVNKDRIKSLNNLNNQISNTLELLRTSDLPLSKLKNQLKEQQDQLDILQNNGLVTPEESSYWYNTRDEALDGLVQMVLDRSHLHFTRSTVVDAETVPWLLGDVPNQTYNPLIPSTFYIVFDHVRRHGAYKQGPTGATVGHFGIKLSPNEFLTSKRKTDFNKIEEVGLVRVITDDPDDVFGYKHFFRPHDNIVDDALDSCNQDELSLGQVYEEAKFKQDYARSMIREDKVIAFGAKPSVGGQSQRSLFDAYPNLDCILHFHCPLRFESRSLFNTTPQFSFECGSQECSSSNLTGFKEYKVSDTHSIWAGHMDYHGPNIVFNSNINPQLVIDFISSHWDLSKKTTGLSSDLI